MKDSKDRSEITIEEWQWDIESFIESAETNIDVLPAKVGGDKSVNFKIRWREDEADEWREKEAPEDFEKISSIEHNLSQALMEAHGEIESIQEQLVLVQNRISRIIELQNLIIWWREG